MAAKREDERGGGFWPGVLAPIGLTFIFGICVWLFVAKNEADRNAVDAANARMAGYARTEAAEIVALARTAAQDFVATRRATRAAQERNLALEAKGILDSVYSLLTLELDKANHKGASRRRVGVFPPGFDGMRRYLEIAPPEDDDIAVAALRANSPEIVTLLPSDCSLAVIEDNARVLYSHGGGAQPAGSVSSTMVRDFIFNDGTKNRNWSLKVELAAPNSSPDPTVEEIAKRLGDVMAGRNIHEARWRGWLLAAGGGSAAGFTNGEPLGPNEIPLNIQVGQWLQLEDGVRVWFDRSGPADGLEWEPAVSVAITAAPNVPEPWIAVWDDTRWGATIAILAVLTLAGWTWFIRSLFAPRADLHAAVANQPVRATGKANPGERRLVRDPAAAREIPEVEGIIVADIGADGRVRVESGSSGNASYVEPARRRIAMPSGSLSRLQAVHRGRAGIAGSRILDQAKSPLLKELAARIRPVVGARSEPPVSVGADAGRNAAEPIAKMKSVKGWKRVEKL